MTENGYAATGDVERTVELLLREAHLTRGDELPALFRRHVAAFGGTDAACYLADLQQNVLVPFSAGPAGATNPTAWAGLEPVEAAQTAKPLSIEATLAGRTFQRLRIETQRSDSGDTIAWVPLLDGTERLGVLAVTLAEPVAELHADSAIAMRLTAFASLLAWLIMTKTLYGDDIVRLRRATQLDLAAEIQWSLLPPLTFVCPQITVAAALEPAYQVAGDSIDYAVDGGSARIAIFDGMGHSLASAQLASMAVYAYRHARRARQSLPDTVLHIDQALLDTFGGTSFATAVIAELNTWTGSLSWVSAGHPEPLLLRGGQLIKTLHTQPRPPLGLRLPASAERTPTVGLEQLEPGDCVLFYTDGVVEARSPDGTFFGEQRLADLVVRNIAAGLPAPETMRRVVRALLTHQQDRLDDDATLLLIQWPAQRQALST